MSDLPPWIPPCVDNCPICGGSGNIPLGDDVDECVNLPIARRIEALEEAAAKARIREGEKDISLGRFIATIVRLKAELEQALTNVRHWKENTGKVEAKREAAEAKLAAVGKLPGEWREEATRARQMAAKARKRDELRGGTSEETALIQSAQDAEGYADELDAALNEESSNE